MRVVEVVVFMVVEQPELLLVVVVLVMALEMAQMELPTRAVAVAVHQMDQLAVMVGQEL